MSETFKNDLIAHLPALRSYAIALSGSVAEADDLVQETIARAWRFRSGFQDGTNLKAWLYKILRNAFYTAVEKTRNTVQDVDGKFAARLASAPEQEWRIQYGEMLKALSQLSDDARDALLLIVGSDLSYDEAAKICGCPVGTLKSRVNRARERLAQLVEGARSPKRAENLPSPPVQLA